MQNYAVKGTAFLFLEEGCCKVDVVLDREALFALKKHEAALRVFCCLLIDYSSLQYLETLDEGEGSVLKCWEECVVRPEEVVKGISPLAFSFPVTLV